jgi:hypothetical protein
MTIAALGAAVLVTGATAGAQTNQQKPGGDKQSRDQVTVDGCLSVNPAARTYILTVKPDELATAAPGAADSATTTITYQLVGGDGLQKHVGDRVEVTGRVEPDTTATARSESERSSTGTSGQQGDDKPKVETKTETKIRAQVLRVQKFRFVEANCKPTEG